MANENPATYSNSAQILKEIYGGVNMISQQRRRSYDLFTKSKRPLAGKYWITADHMEGASGAAGTRPDNIELPAAQAEVYQNGKVFDRYHYAGFMYTGPAIRHAKDNVSSFVNLITSEIENKTRWLIDNLNIQTYMDSWGILGLVAASPAESYSGSTESFSVSSCPNPLWIRKGTRVDFYPGTFKSSGTPTKRTAGGSSGAGPASGARGGASIVTWNPSTLAATITVAADPTTIAAGDQIVLEDICGGSGNLAGGGEVGKVSTSVGHYGGGLYGLELMIDGTTNAASYQSIDRSIYTEYQAGVMSNSGTARPLTLDLLQKCMDLIRINSQEEADTIISGLGQRRNLLALGLPDVRFTAESIKLGFVGSLTFNGREWIVDEIAPTGKVYMMKRQDNIHKYESLPMGPLDDDVAPARQRISGFDKYEGYIANYFNLGCDRPNATAKVIDLMEPA